MLHLTWHAPENGADHYRLEITKRDMTNESSTALVSTAYTQNNHFQIEPENGYTYSVRIKAVNSQGVYSDFSEQTIFSLNDVKKPANQPVSLNTSPLTFSLLQNQPNPFNPVTTITYFLPNDAHVKLFIYNISGQKVTELQNGIIEAGTHSVVWNAREMPSGTYFYTLTSGRFTESKKMILVK